MLNKRVTLAALVLAASTIALAGCVPGPVALPPCESEDSVSCYWDASTRGNGQGRSFWVNEYGAVYYVNE